MKRLPIIALVGQANVGKSSLLNALSRVRRSIVAKEAGTTRDSVSELINLGDRAAWLVDTAGQKDPADDFEMTIQNQIGEAIESADLICLVIAAPLTLSQVDRQLAKKALAANKKVCLLANKIDQAQDKGVADFTNLGISDIFLTSATTRQGLDLLINYFATNLPVKKPPARAQVTVSLIGRPNVGKSALFNVLGAKRPSLVDDQAGTTRDVNKQIIGYNGQKIEFCDTAGIRRQSKVGPGVEKFSVLRSLAAIEASDVCLLLIDSQEPAVALEQKLAGQIIQAGKGLVLTLTKWDLAEANQDDWLKPRLRKEFSFAPWAGLILTSAKTGQNISKILDLVLEIDQQRRRKISTSELNRCLRATIEHHPPAGLKGRRPNPNYLTQTDTCPPTFRLFGSHLDFLHWSWKRFLERSLRQTFNLTGTALKFEFANKRPR